MNVGKLLEIKRVAIENVKTEIKDQLTSGINSWDLE